MVAGHRCLCISRRSLTGGGVRWEMKLCRLGLAADTGGGTGFPFDVGRDRVIFWLFLTVDRAPQEALLGCNTLVLRDARPVFD